MAINYSTKPLRPSEARLQPVSHCWRQTNASILQKSDIVTTVVGNMSEPSEELPETASSILIQFFGLALDSSFLHVSNLDIFLEKNTTDEN